MYRYGFIPKEIQAMSREIHYIILIKSNPEGCTTIEIKKHQGLPGTEPWLPIHPIQRQTASSTMHLPSEYAP